MEILYLLEAIRTPFLDQIMSLVTHLGSELFLIVGSLVVLWCIDKKWGYYLLFVSSISTTINQFLKNYFSVLRPWLKDPTFTVVESAKEAATGYSFPSGHTQTAVGFFGGLIRVSKNRLVQGLALIMILLVAFSRMYLGVHTFSDVALSIILGVVLVLVVYPLFFKFNKEYPAMFVGVVFALFHVIYMELKLSGLMALDEVALDGIKNAYTCLGLALAIPIVYYLDQKYIKYPIKAVWWAQIIKCGIGLVIMLGIRVILKEPLYLLTNGHHIADMVRYFLLAFAGGALWPMTFKYFSKLK